MAFLKVFGSYLPAREVSNEEIGALVGCDSEWIRNVSGIESRRFAAADETVADMAYKAGLKCLESAGLRPLDLSMILVASGSSERQFPGPASKVAHLLGLGSVPAVDLPMASCGSLFGISLASKLAATTGNILVIGAEKMSSIVMRQPMDRGIAVLFGDGAGACLVTPDNGVARIVDSELHSDGAFADELKVEFNSPLQMNGRAVILQATRKIPRVITGVFERNSLAVSQAQVFLMHQANQNLILKIAASLGVGPDRFYSNIARYGNTSSASMLIAADEWCQAEGFKPDTPVCFAAFGAGFHWGALLAMGT